MSLSVALLGPEREEQQPCPNCQTLHAMRVKDVVFTADLSGVLAPLAHEAGIFLALWHPQQLAITKAEYLIEPLRKGLAYLEVNCPALEGRGGERVWGKYGDFVSFVESYLAASKAHPEATVEVTR